MKFTYNVSEHIHTHTVLEWEMYVHIQAIACKCDDDMNAYD